MAATDGDYDLIIQKNTHSPSATLFQNMVANAEAQNELTKQQNISASMAAAEKFNK